MKHNVEFLLEIGSSIPHHGFLTDEQRIKSILINLLSNSVKFTTDGQIKLTADLSVDRDGSRNLHLEFFDTGAGIE